MPAKAFTTRECYFYVVPGGTFLFEAGLPYLPTQGMLIDYHDAETSTTIRYRVQDVILKVVEVAAVPPDPGPPPTPGQPIVHIPHWRIEIAMVP